MTKDMVIIGAGMLVLCLVVWSFRGTPEKVSPARTEAARVLADDPALKHVSEESPYMRTER
ncbi:hypothetical protein [Bradyrhizobium archetypum]|jgi:hypothetical protein|uniref:Uncharacterized protein n=1 Tax=Bradyrhizobium archetypum TaxID=2721160 RepID=A0A7Y4H9K3_9BRAD|nr:hypothetical protein [Bradyrhizobium archetypum]NOJ49657.1 hypothetical protein [Bradyrhizobium archetypum]